MISKLIEIAARFTVGKHVVAGIAWAHDKADGHRSEIIMGSMVLVYVLGKIGVVPESASHAVNAILAPMLPVTLADKFSKAQAMIESVAPQKDQKPL